MVQNKSEADLMHSRVMSAVQVESKGICAALWFHLGDPLSGGKGPRTSMACVIYGTSC